jgi:formylmethanofuran dehydrogenase subunit A
MNLLCLKGGHVIDPANGIDARRDIWLAGGSIVEAPRNRAASRTIDVSGKIVMAGAIDIHTHIAGGNVNLSRLLLPELHGDVEPHLNGDPLSRARWSTFDTGRRYAEMGFTTLVEPAVATSGAVQAHLELADIPYVDRAGLAVLGNDDFLLELLRKRESVNAIADYVAWTLRSTRCLGVKTINAGGAAAFKDNVRKFSLDDGIPSYGVTSRTILCALQDAVERLGIAHPLHVHCNNLGIPGNIGDILATIDAARGGRLHFAHAQFYAYGNEGKRGFSTAAGQLAEAVNKNKNITVDIGQVMFGQTVTVSSDALRQFTARASASPKKWIVWDGEGNGGGIVPYNYRQKDFFNALQWAIGLELFLLIDDPWRVYFTTDHPNGAPFTSYPKLLQLLMDASERERWMQALPKSAVAASILPGLKREYSLTEIATMTRAAPAKLLGLSDRGHLGEGAIADVAIYDDIFDRSAMFSAARLVFKDGHAIVKDGKALKRCFGRTLAVAPDYDPQIDKRVAAHFEYAFGVPANAFAVPEMLSGRGNLFADVPCRS